MGKINTTLSDTFSLRGDWWLPDTPERKIAGRLTFSPEGPAELDLNGTFHETPGSLGSFSSPVIFGTSPDGKCYTVGDAHEFTLEIYVGCGATSKFFYNQLFVGKEFVDPQSIKFESAMVGITELGSWLDRDPFKIERDAMGGRIPRFAVEYTTPKSKSIRVEALEASFGIESSWSVHNEYQERTIRHEDSLRIKPRRKQSLEWYLAAILKFRILMSLLVGEPVNLTAIRLCPRRQKASQQGLTPDREYLDLCIRQLGKKKDKEVLPHEIPFPYPALRKDLRMILDNWYNKAERMRTLYGLHFGVQVNKGTPVDFQFLALIQAIESYHRETGTDKYMSEIQYAPVREALVKAIPVSVGSDHRAALKKRIEFGNEYSLQKRLRLTLRRIPRKSVDMITYGDQKFVARVVATRNYLTHRDKSQTKDVLDSKGMFNVCEGLKLLITYLLLRECGLNPEFIQSVMQTHLKFKNRPRIL
jgi:hypothetical protein